MTRNEILRGIEAYRIEQREILDAIEDHGGQLTQKEFDAQFKDFFVVILPNNGDSVQERANSGLKFQAKDRQSFLLGTEPGYWPKYFELAQIMGAAGILSITEEAGLTIYRKREQTIGARRKSRRVLHHPPGRHRAVKSP